MKTLKIAYWISTALIILMMLNSAYMCFESPFMKASLMHLGFPDYFRVELGSTKLLGALALGIPVVPRKIKEFAYSGFIIMFASGVAAHLIVSDPATMWGVGLFAFMVLLVSYFSFQKLQITENSANLIVTPKSDADMVAKAIPFRP